MRMQNCDYGDFLLININTQKKDDYITNFRL